MFFFKKSYCCVDAIFKNSYFYMIQKKPISILGAFQYKVLHDLRHHSVFIFDDEERGQNSRKNWRRGETEHKCININFSLKVFWKNLNDIDLLNFAKRIFFLLFVIVGDVGKIFSSLSINLIRKSRMVRI